MKPKKTSNEIALSPRLLAGSIFTKICFSNDSRYLFCCCGSVIKVYNTTNGECLHDLIGHAAGVTGVAVNSSNVLQIYSCCEDGLLISWDYLDGVKLKQHSFHMPVYGIVSVDAKTDSIMMIAKPSQKSSNYSLLHWFHQKDNPSEFSKPKVLIGHCNRDQELVSFGCNNQYVASALKDELTVYCMKKETIKMLRIKDKHDKGKPITAVACHPTEYCIATGIVTGRIFFWYNFFDDQKPLTSDVHWHSLAVLSLDYSPDGSILLSGGHECVFVRWQVNNQYQKDFKPRMGSPLTKVLCSPDGNFFVTQHADNVIQVMDINLSILHVHRGMSRDNWNLDPKKRPFSTGLIYDPRSRAIITNSLPGHLQFYSLALQKQLYNLDIVGQNYISPENLDRPANVTEVKKAAISEDGKWLASFEIWDDVYFTPELRLKFWEYSSSEKMYVLNTIVETPHEKEITSMCFRPTPSPSSNINPSPKLVTTGADRCFKLWTLVDDTDIYRANNRWNCDSVGFYKDMNTFCADFSCDGSSLAVGFEYFLSIWDPTDNIIRTTLSNKPKDKENIRALKFGSGNSRYFIVSLSEKCITSWNLLSLTVEWTIDTSPLLLIKDPMSELMATVDQNSTLTVFKADSRDGVYCHKKISDASVLDAVFVPNNRPEDICDVGWPGKSQIYIFTSKHTLLTLDRSDRIQQIEKIQIHQRLPKSGLSAAFMAEKVVREQGASDVKEKQDKVHVLEDEFLSTMLHSNEPISAFCDQFLDKLLIKRKQKSKSRNDTKEDKDEVEESMDVAEENEDEKFDSTDTIVDPALVDFFKEESKTSDRNASDLNRLLSKPSDWKKFLALK